MKLGPQSLVPFSAFLRNLTWPVLRMGSELFLEVVLVTLVMVCVCVVFENWPQLLKLHESSKMEFNLGGPRFLKNALREKHLKTQSRFLRWREMWSPGHIVFSGFILSGLLFISSTEKLKKQKLQLWRIKNWLKMVIATLVKDSQELLF